MSPNSLKNLRQFTPGENARKNGRIGGINSVQARKHKKNMSEIAKKIAAADIADEQTKAKLIEQYGLEEEELINDALLTAKIFQEASRGNMRAVDKWQELTQEKKADDKQFLLPAKLLGKAFIDINREIQSNRVYVFRGGRGSLKSSYISLKIVEILKNHPQMHACVVRKVGATLKDSVYAQLTWAIGMLGLEDDWEFRKSPLEIECKSTGQKIYFRGSDDPVKLKSIKPPFGYLGLLWKEEWDQLAGPSEDRSINQSVLRGGDIAYEFCSFNPPKSRSSWVNKIEMTPDDRRIIHTSTYKDAPPSWLGQRFIDDAEHLKEVNPEAYEHEYEGIANGDGGSVFPYMTFRKIDDDEIKNFDKLYAGVDWGYYPDPYAFVLVYYDQTRDTIIPILEHYGQKWTNKETAEWIKDNCAYLLEKDVLTYGIVCDSAEMKSIADYLDNGIWNAKAAWKPPGSVSYGMKWLSSKKIIIDETRTPNIAREFREYEYLRDKDGNVMSGYPDKDNHTIDSMRYALSPLFMSRYTP